MVILANDVFKPIMYGTAELLGLAPSYVDDTSVFFPHPTSNLDRSQIFRLVDARIDEIANVLLGKRQLKAGRMKDEGISGIKAALAPFCQSLHEDGAELTIGELHGGTLETRLEVREACEDGTCVLPREQLTAIVASMLRDFPQVVNVRMADSREA